MDDNDQPAARRHAMAAREHVYGFNRATMWDRDHLPSETSDELADLADLVAALPQAFPQLSSARSSRCWPARCSAWTRWPTSRTRQWR